MQNTIVKGRVGSSCWHQPLLAAATLAALQSCPLVAAAQPATPYGAAAPMPAAGGSLAPAPMRIPVGGSIELKVRRLADAVELVIEGVGTAPQLQQSSRGAAWEGLLLTSAPNSLRRGPQGFSLPEVGFQSVRIDGSGSTYRLQVTPVPGYPVGRPVVSADGRDLILSFAAPAQASLQTARPDLSQPGRVPQSSFVPPLQARAVAPPLGDMAVGTMMLTNPSFVNVSGPPVTMTLRNAPVKDVLMRLSSMGGYGFAYVDDAKTPNAATRNVTIAFQNESFSRAFNSVLLSAALQGHRDGTMIMVGPNVLDKGFGSTLSKVYRLNQVSPSAAADYLANLGATVTKTNTITTAVTEGASQNNAVAGAPNVATTNASTSTTVESYGSGVGPLRGLIGTTDTRLNTITLVGSPKVVAIAEQYLKQLDLRQRQVALSVKILDVSLENDSSIANSFAFRYGNNFIVNDEGNLAGAWGSYLPPSSRLGLNSLVGPISNPGLQYPKNQFFDVLKATIQSQSTKLLASPTLILTDNPEEISGGGEVVTASTTTAGGAAQSVFSSSTIGRKRSNESFVTVGTQVITNYTVTTGTQGNGNACEPEFSTSGLTFGARVNKIDDNGFVTFNLSPSVSAVTDTQAVQGCGPINILSIRRLDTGAVRVRDGQTLILTGVISDFNTQGVNKWPILGDMPLIGQFFRSTSGTRTKNELVILVTPHIINDNEGGTYGYGYQPSSGDARRLLGGNNP